MASVDLRAGAEGTTGDTSSPARRSCRQAAQKSAQVVLAYPASQLSKRRSRAAGTPELSKRTGRAVVIRRRVRLHILVSII